MDNAHQAAKSKEVYSTIKKINRKANIKMQTVKNKEGQVLTEMEDVKRRWQESYEELYNSKNPINKEVADEIPQMPDMEQEPEILREEVISAIKKMTDGKAPGYDTVTAEELKASGESGIDILHKLCKQIWTNESFPTDHADWGRAIITPIFKKKDKLDWKLPGDQFA